MQAAKAQTIIIVHVYNVHVMEFHILEFNGRTRSLSVYTKTNCVHVLGIYSALALCILGNFAWFNFLSPDNFFQN